MFYSPARCLFFCAVASLVLTGCVRGPMTFHAGNRTPDFAPSSTDGGAAQIYVVQGHPNKLVDGAGWVFGIPRKVMLWNSHVDNHSVQPETMAEVATYAQINHLDGLCIRANQYAPLDEWRRLRENERVSPGWKYTLGTLSVAGYALLPGRLFGGDEYNPYTHSVYIHSDVPALALEAAAYASDVQSRDLPGTYAAVNALPVVSIWRETISTQNTLEYMATHGTRDDHMEALTILYPNYGASVGGAFGTLVGATPAFELGGALVGHISGQHKAALLDPEAQTARLEFSEPDKVILIPLKTDEDQRQSGTLLNVSQARHTSRVR